MAICKTDKEDVCICKDCSDSDCERFGCKECRNKEPDKIHEVFVCNGFKKWGDK